jgi:hypothetical protein
MQCAAAPGGSESPLTFAPCLGPSRPGSAGSTTTLATFPGPPGLAPGAMSHAAGAPGAPAEWRAQPGRPPDAAGNGSGGEDDGDDESMAPADAPRSPARRGAAITSKYRGVCWNKKNHRWQAAINCKGVTRPQLADLGAGLGLQGRAARRRLRAPGDIGGSPCCGAGCGGSRPAGAEGSEALPSGGGAPSLSRPLGNSRPGGASGPTFPAVNRASPSLIAEAGTALTQPAAGPKPLTLGPRTPPLRRCPRPPHPVTPARQHHSSHPPDPTIPPPPPLPPQASTSTSVPLLTRPRQPRRLTAPPSNCAASGAASTLTLQVGAPSRPAPGLRCQPAQPAPWRASIAAWMASIAAPSLSGMMPSHALCLPLTPPLATCPPPRTPRASRLHR